jgi:L-fuconolactonase
MTRFIPLTFAVITAFTLSSTGFAEESAGIGSLTAKNSPLSRGEVIAFFGDSITQGDADTSTRPEVKHFIDTHIHLYDTTRPKGVPWPPKDDTVLYKPFLRKDFNRAAKPAGVTGVVIVEASNRPEDNQWVLDHVKDDKFYIALVGNLDMTAADFSAQLDELRKDKRVVGLRLRPAPKWDSNNRNLIASAKAMAERNLTLDVLIGTVSVADCDYIARQVPELTIVANHALGYKVDGGPPRAKWAAQATSLAKNPNVYCKISGLYQRCIKQPASRDINHYKTVLDFLYKQFGPKRLIYGSNWPCTVRSGDYASFVTLVDSYFAPKTSEVLSRG